MWGDTDLMPAGGGTMGSRSLQRPGPPSTRRPPSWSSWPGRWPPTQLEAAEADIVLDTERGVFHVAGTPAVTTSWAELARRRRRSTASRS